MNSTSANEYNKTNRMFTNSNLLRYFFQGLTNWGRESMVADLTPDADAIQVLAFIQVS